MHDPMLFTLDLILREKKSFLRSSTVTHVGSVTIDVKDESVGHDEEPQWHQLLTGSLFNWISSDACCMILTLWLTSSSIDLSEQNKNCS